MKKILLLITCTFLIVTSEFAQVTSNVIVFSEDANPFYLLVNGIRQNFEPQTNVKITGLTNPTNHIRIVFRNGTIPSLNKTINFVEIGNEATMKITKTKKGYKLKYFGEIAISGVTKPNGNQWSTVYTTVEPTAVNSTGTTTTNSTNTATNTQGGTTTNNTSGTVTTTNASNTSTTSNSTTTSNTITSNGNSTNGTTITGTTTPTTTTGGTFSNSTNTSSSNQSTALHYTWAPGALHSFSATQIDNISTSMMGMNINEQIKTTTDLVLLINGVTSTGNATGTLYLTNFKITDSKQNVLASISDVPKSAIQSEVSVDRKGHFTFLKKVFLITSETSNVLAYGSATSNSVQMGGEAGNMKVDAYAEFNPKTGAIKAGYSVKEIKSTKSVEVKVNQETQMIDVFPYDFLELLELPEGVITQGDKMNVKSGMYTMVVTANAIQNGMAQINTTIATDKKADMFGGGINGNSGSNTMDMKVDGTEGMDLTPEDKAAIGMGQAMSPEMTGNINTNFNYGQGMFQSISGTINTVIDAMGMKMKVNSVLEMKKIN